jgi:histidinol dehydrogenase
VRIVQLGPRATAADIRALSPSPPEVEADVRAILEEVRRDGDAGLLRLTKRFDGADLRPEELRVSAAELEASTQILEPAVREGLQTAIANLRTVVEAQLRDPVMVELPEGQRVAVAELPVRRAAVCVPAARAPLPSSLVMGAVTAMVAGVEEIAVCAAPSADGQLHAVILAACRLCGVSEVYKMGGAQAIAALAYGTESVPPVDVIAGPGSPWVQEAKRQLVGLVGIDGIAGPSELVVVADAGQDPEPIALDLLAQAEHGEDGLLALISSDEGMLRTAREAMERMVPQRPSVSEAPLALVHARDTSSAVRLADEVAPEHLALVGAEAEGEAGSVRAAGCLFVGAAAATAFGDYVAGSNHVLPTGGAARFQSALSAATFRRRMASVSFPDDAASRLAAPGAALARAEGLPVHAESMERRA